MTSLSDRPGDPELRVIETLEQAIADPGHTFTEPDRGLVAAIEGELYGRFVDYTMDGSCSLNVGPAGYAAVDAFRARQSDAAARRRNLMDQYLRYVWEQADQGSDAYPDRFAATKPIWCGDVYTAQEIERAGKWLHDRELIGGVMANNSSAPIRARITPRGEDVVERGRSVWDESTQPGGAQFVISGGNNQIASHSQHVSQKQDNRSGAAAVLELVAEIRRHLPELADEERPAVEVTLGELEAEAEGPARGARLRELSNKAVTAAIAAGASAGATQIVERLMPHLQNVMAAIHGG